MRAKVGDWKFFEFLVYALSDQLAELVVCDVRHVWHKTVGFVVKLKPARKVQRGSNEGLGFFGVRIM